MLLKVPLLAKWRRLRKARQTERKSTASSSQTNITTITGRAAANVSANDGDSPANDKNNKVRGIEAKCISPTTPCRTEHLVVSKSEHVGFSSKEKPSEGADRARPRQDDDSLCGREPMTEPSLLFTVLPQELRDLVYDFIWWDLRDIFFQHHKIFVHACYGAKPAPTTHERSSTNNSGLPRWLLTNKQLQHEALEQFYRNVWFSPGVAVAKQSRTPGLLTLDRAKKLDLAIVLRVMPTHQASVERCSEFRSVDVSAAYFYTKHFARVIRPSMTELSVTLSFWGIRLRGKEVYYHLGFLTRKGGILHRQWNSVEFVVDESTLEQYWERPDWYVEQLQQLRKDVIRRGRKLIGENTCEEAGRGGRVLCEGMVEEDVPADAARKKWRVVVYRHGY